MENIMGKEENTGYQHFLLFQPRFQKVLSRESLKVGNVWKRVNPFLNDKYLAFPKSKNWQMTIFSLIKNEEKLSERVENTVGKEEIARCEQFLLFPHCF